MLTRYLYDVNGKAWPYLVPENERERRELTRRTEVATGGIDSRDEWEPEHDWSDE